MKAHYRKYNDGSQSSSTYHKKDGTNVRANVRAKSKNWLIKELKALNPRLRREA
jgi:hypothetical protein